ncbi:hypothetical protein ES703_73480 [subsurface metagenome]
MSAKIRLSKKGLIDLIETTEQTGGDATQLREFLELVENDARQHGASHHLKEQLSDEEYLKEKRDQSQVEHGTDLECMICHQKFDHLLSGTCEVCFRKWVLSTKK